MASKCKQIVERAVIVFKADEDIKNDIRGAFMLLAAFAEIVLACSKSGTPEERAALKDDATSAYHEFIAPLDLPGVPNFIEPLIDTYLAGAIGAGIDAGYARLAYMQAQIDAIVAEAK